MEREIDLSQISDGKLYIANDMVKIACNDCAGCSLCCQGMGSSIILDPYDMYCLEKGLVLSCEQLLADKVELNVVEGIIQPNLKMQGERECCAFLSEEGRCTIHTFRPGFCRMFPLGRVYENDGFKYFLQVHECGYPEKSKVKVKKWLGIPEIGKYETFVCDWHYFLKKLQHNLEEVENEAVVKQLSMYLLNQFYLKPYNEEMGFYEQFYQRLDEAKGLM